MGRRNSDIGVAACDLYPAEATVVSPNGGYFPLPDGRGSLQDVDAKNRAREQAERTMQEITLMHDQHRGRHDYARDRAEE